MIHFLASSANFGGLLTGAATLFGAATGLALGEGTKGLGPWRKAGFLWVFISSVTFFRPGQKYQSMCMFLLLQPITTSKRPTKLCVTLEHDILPITLKYISDVTNPICLPLVMERHFNFYILERDWYQWKTQLDSCRL